MSTNTDDIGERVAHIEGTVEQMDKRLADLSTRMDERFDALQTRMDDRFQAQDSKLDDRFETLDSKVDDTRTEIRNWLVLVVLVMSVGIGSLQLVLYF